MLFSIVTNISDYVRVPATETSYSSWDPIRATRQNQDIQREVEDTAMFDIQVLTRVSKYIHIYFTQSRSDRHVCINIYIQYWHKEFDILLLVTL